MKSKEKAGGLLRSLPPVCFIVGSIIFRKAVQPGFAADLALCVQTLLPSLFPMLAASSLLAKTGVPSPVRKIWQFIVGAAAGMPEAGAAASLLGCTAGYPIGVKTAAALYRDQNLDQKNAKLLCYANVHPGIAFSVFAVGLGMFRSARLGWSFYVSVLLADVLISRIIKRILKPEKTPQGTGPARKAPTLSEALPAAVGTAISSITEICGWVLLSGALRRMADAVLPEKWEWLTAITEVTNAAVYSVKKGAPVFCAFALGFGGISLMLQLLRDLQDVGINPANYLFCRSIAGGLSAAFEWGLMKLLPPEAIQTGSVQIKAVNAAAGLPGTAALILLCIVFIAEFSPEVGQNGRDAVKPKRRKFTKNNA